MKGLLFTPEMARAVCEGRKTQTRRVIVPQPYASGLVRPYLTEAGWWFHSACHGVRCPYRAGERVCLLTTWAVHSMFQEVKPCALDKVAFAKELDLWHAGMSVPKYEEAGKLRPGRFLPNHLRPLMPQLEIVSVRAERVQDISEEDAKAEGVAIDKGHTYVVAGHERDWAHHTARGCFETLWDSINAKRGFGWQQNPWVWVVTFGRRTPGGG